MVEAFLTVLAQDPRFRDIPVAVIGEAPPDFADALPNIDQVAADPRRPDGATGANARLRGPPQANAQYSSGRTY